MTTATAPPGPSRMRLIRDQISSTAPVCKTVVTAKPVVREVRRTRQHRAIGADGTIITPGVQAGIDEGRIAMADKSSAPNLEVVVSAAPRLVVLSSPYDTESKSRMEAAGLPAFVHTATSEITPLSRADSSRQVQAQASSRLLISHPDAVNDFPGRSRGLVPSLRASVAHVTCGTRHALRVGVRVPHTEIPTQEETEHG